MKKKTQKQKKVSTEDIKSKTRNGDRLNMQPH